MKLFIVLVFWSLSSWATDPDCRGRIISSLKTDSEKYLIKNHPDAIDKFVTDCRQIEFGDLGMIGVIIAVHEATHFEDLGFKNKEKKEDLNLYLISGKHIGGFKDVASFPKINSLVNLKIKEKYLSLISSIGTPFMGIHSGYIADPDSMAADHLIGMATELNGYTHGLKIEARIKKDFPLKVKLKANNGSMIEVDNSLKALKQTEGVYYFLFTFNLYLTELKNKYPEKWKILSNQENKKLLKQLFESSISTLKEINHCENTNDGGNSPYWIKLMNDIKPSDALMEYISEEDRLSLNCRSATENLKIIKKSLSTDKECIE